MLIIGFREKPKHGPHYGSIRGIPITRAALPDFEFQIPDWVQPENVVKVAFVLLRLIVDVDEARRLKDSFAFYVCCDFHPLGFSIFREEIKSWVRTEFAREKYRGK